MEMGLAVNGRQQDDAGNWVDKPNFFDVKVYGNQAEMLSQHLAKGRRVGIDGRLDGARGKPRTGRSDRRSTSSRGRSSFSTAARTERRLHTSCRRRRERGRLPDLAGRRRHSLLGATMASKKQQPRRRTGPTTAPGRRKSCHFCRDKVAEIDYENIAQLGGTSPRREDSLAPDNRRLPGHQIQVASAVKRAREMALLPYVG